MSSWMWLLLVIVIILIVWWLLTSSAKESPSELEVVEDHHVDHGEEEPTITDENAPKKEATPEEETVPVDPDDLKKIEGIGPKISSLLADAGILTFSQLADTDVARIDEILDAAGLTFSNAESWPRQAQLAAEGKWEELDKLQDELHGGRQV